MESELESRIKQKIRLFDYFPLLTLDSDLFNQLFRHQATAVAHFVIVPAYYFYQPAYNGCKLRVKNTAVGVIQNIG
jgi:hypothetical protein